jgi:hypothetical protein
VGGPPYIPLRTEIATFVSRTGTGDLIGYTSGSDGNGGLIKGDGTTQTLTLTTTVGGTLNYYIYVSDFYGTPTASISLGGTVLHSLTGNSNYTGTSPVSAGQTIVFTFTATAPMGNFQFSISIP